MVITERRATEKNNIGQKKGGEVEDWNFKQDDVEGLPEKVTLGQRPVGGEGGGHASPWKKSILARGNSQFKGPEAGSCLA